MATKSSFLAMTVSVASIGVCIHAAHASGLTGFAGVSGGAIAVQPPFEPFFSGVPATVLLSLQSGSPFDVAFEASLTGDTVNSTTSVLLSLTNASSETITALSVAVGAEEGGAFVPGLGASFASPPSFNADASVLRSPSEAFLPLGSPLFSGAVIVELDFAGAGRLPLNDPFVAVLRVTPVPEPSSALAVCIGLAVVTRRRR